MTKEQLERKILFGDIDPAFLCNSDRVALGYIPLGVGYGTHDFHRQFLPKLLDNPSLLTTK